MLDSWPHDTLPCVLILVCCAPELAVLGHSDMYTICIIVTGFWKNDPNRTLEVSR